MISVCRLILKFADCLYLTYLIAIWDNRSVYHAATWDYEEIGPRTGHRAVGLGERPYLDPKSTGRREALDKDE